MTFYDYSIEEIYNQGVQVCSYLHTAFFWWIFRFAVGFPQFSIDLQVLVGFPKFQKGLSFQYEICCLFIDIIVFSYVATYARTKTISENANLF